MLQGDWSLLPLVHSPISLKYISASKKKGSVLIPLVSVINLRIYLARLPKMLFIFVASHLHSWLLSLGTVLKFFHSLGTLFGNYSSIACGSWLLLVVVSLARVSKRMLPLVIWWIPPACALWLLGLFDVCHCPFWHSTNWLLGEMYQVTRVACAFGYQMPCN